MPFIFGKLPKTETFCLKLSLYFLWYILLGFEFDFFWGEANDASEKLAVVGFTTNMLSYLTTQLNMPLTKAANTMTNFNGTASLTPLLGAFIADSYAGKFWTITVASLIYQIVNTLPLYSLPLTFIIIQFLKLKQRRV